VRFADANQHALRISLTKDDVEAKGWLVSLVSDEEVSIATCKQASMYNLYCCNLQVIASRNLNIKK